MEWSGKLLVNAAQEGNLEDVRGLLGAGADKDYVDGGAGTALYQATCGFKFSVVEFLLAQGADANIVDTEYGLGPLHAACHDGFLRAARLLVGAGVSIGQGQTPLMTACSGGSDIMVEWLLSSGASVKPVDKYGRTCLHYACWAGKAGDFISAKSLQLLLDHGVDIHRRDSRGKTALMYAREDYSGRRTTMLANLLEKQTSNASSSKKIKLVHEKENSKLSLDRLA